MNFTRTSIPDVIIIDPKIHGDERGYFVETFRQDTFEAFLGFKVNFIQDNESRSHHGVLRGLHYQLAPFAQSKLVRVIDGRVLDVAVDIRVGSPTFGQHVAVELSGKNKRQMFVPRGFAHGFVVLSETCTFTYKVDNYYAPECDRGISFKDSNLGIDWQIPPELLHLSAKDITQPKLEDTLDLFEYKVNYYA
ncbi:MULTISPECIES: dTDP-4-dehydrorhamnose 3,5-epimerase [unclassified Sulfurospirillum]|uniref:dTDP-4-dehydrorhamnose 3,5-epimerase n=1 Tax=unclassified Sulfurospirillum TaxID=2618290 RepID=UPI000507AB00|nr:MULTISPECIES: dTDP-4-dehydrorhamnose 3,5-epimerase [unclassified Sulfurospirillum]KFL33545.1 dTDP-4-dehydrorhamnose 3,5-epimerase [Sulfurospirillum sp. SCADC]